MIVTPYKMDVRQYAKIPVYIEEDHHEVSSILKNIGLYLLKTHSNDFRYCLIYFVVSVLNTYLCMEM